jgi:hypothetical protein
MKVFIEVCVHLVRIHMKMNILQCPQIASDFTDMGTRYVLSGDIEVDKGTRIGEN